MYILLPDLYLLYFNQNVHIFLMSVFVFVYIYSILKTTKYLFLLLPFLIIIPIYLYYISIYKTAINEQIISVVLETNFNEAIEFLGTKIYLYIFLFLIWSFYSIFFVVQHYKNPKVWSHWSRKLFLVLGSFYFIINVYFNDKISDQIDQTIDSRDAFLVEEDNAFIAELKTTYPLGLMINIWYVWKEQNKINQAYEKNKKFNFKAYQDKNNNKEIYILVIGETSRRENWQLNGYFRKTNPLLSERENLVNLTDFISVSNVTRQSVPMMLTRKPDRYVNRYTFGERSLITAFKEAGFETYWLSTQQKFGAFDTSTSVYAKEADNVQFLNKAGYQHMGVYDDILASELEKIVKQSIKKQFIVIHTLGSHYNYSHRYPSNFDYFKPSLTTVKNHSLHSSTRKEELINSYDNSILFTDYVINQFIAILDKQKNTTSFLMYSSDHGEDIFDGNCKKSGHGLETARNFEIASFIWYSDLFKSHYVNKVSSLEKNKDRPINHTSIFPTLIDAANITIPNDRLERSLLTEFKNYPRLVMGGKDYDQSKFLGECKEIK